MTAEDRRTVPQVLQRPPPGGRRALVRSVRPRLPATLAVIVLAGTPVISQAARTMHARGLFLFLAAPLLAHANPAQGQAGKSISLFNGTDLTGWHADIPAADKDANVRPSFIVRDGKLVSLGTPRGHLITDRKFSNFMLEVEYRFPGRPGNCGVLVHASTPRALYEMFPASIEVQMNSGHAGDFWCIHENIIVPDMEKRRPRGKNQKWGGRKGDSRRILNLTDNSEKPLGEWNSMLIQCKGNEIIVHLNGELVNHGDNCTVSSGQIALQAEGAEVEFRKLQLTPLKD